MCQKGFVSAIQRFCIHDGPGIRTTVFLQGCPLRCPWCHNPEMQPQKPILIYSASLCVGCGMCAEVCPNNCHKFINGNHTLDRSDCISCGKCTQSCVGALKMSSSERTSDQIIDVVKEDIGFYRESGGGITISGGEPLMQVGFSAELLKKAKDAGIHTCIETSGYEMKHCDIKKLANVTDLFLFDWKISDEATHKSAVGVSNKRIYHSLEQLNEYGADIILRCPAIPQFCTEKHLLTIAALSKKFRAIKEVHIMPYHTYGIGKYASIGRKYSLNGIEPFDDGEIEKYKEIIQSRTDAHVKIE